MSIHTFLPIHVLRDLKKRNPGKTDIAKSLDWALRLRRRRLRIVGKLPHFGHGIVNARVDTGKAQVQIYDAQKQEVQPGVRARFEGDPAVADAVVNNSYDFNTIVREFYRTVFGRFSIDNKGMDLVSTVHYGDGFNNAFWDGVQMVYGDGDGTLFTTFVWLDVTGHEMTHGVTEFDSGEEYRGMSGALNESNSDIGGEMIEQWHFKQTADKADWLVGKGIWAAGINGVALRSMKDPGKAYDDPQIGKDPQPAHMDQYVKTRQDQGGVHINSGIPNRAFYLFCIAMGGNSWELPGQIWYEARKLAGSTPSFYQFAHWTLEVCKAKGVAGAEAKLLAAWSAVGVTPDKDKGDDLTPRRRVRGKSRKNRKSK